ncbi:MAG: transcriptional repressor LexA [Oscillospiraceae bacterium]|nr:transcriptional repressor LexA [Oscillospiraceae bacterium]
MKALTSKQLKVLECIKDSIERFGYPPSVREICRYVSLRSPSTVQAHLNTLEQLGYISRAGGRSRSIVLNDSAYAGGIPILGTVAAGEPILAVEDAVGYIDYDAGSGEFFALRIKGLSMVNAGILDGDMVIVRRQPTAENGEIVVALIDDSATCKRLSLDNGTVTLLPENDEYEPIDGSGAAILGKVCAVIRRYD